MKEFNEFLPFIYNYKPQINNFNPRGSIADWKLDPTKRSEFDLQDFHNEGVVITSCKCI